MVRRLCSILLLLALLAAFVTVPMAAENAVFVVQVPAAPIKAGSEFRVTIQLKGNPGFSEVSLALGYQNTGASCTQIVRGELLREVLSAENPDRSGEAVIAGVSLTPVTKDGTLAELIFQAQSDIESLSLSLNDFSLSDADGNKLPCSTVTETAQPKQPAPSGGGSSQTSQKEEEEEQTQPEQQTPVYEFSDLNGHWGKDAVLLAAQKGLFKGFPDGTFRPDERVTRAQFVTVLWRMSDSPEPTKTAPFTDIAGLSGEFQKAICWGYEKGYLSGTSKTTFSPDDALTREAAMKILFLYDGGMSGMEQMFTQVYDDQFLDSDAISAWAKPALYWGVYKEILSGTGGGKLSPQGTATRAQLAKILVQYLEKRGTL